MERWPTTRSTWVRPSAYVCGLLLAVALGARASAQLAPQSLLFRMDGELQKTYTVAELQRLSGPSAIRVFEPYEEADVRFVGVSLNSVLDTVYGEGWRSRDEVLLTCRDGYQPSFPVSRLLAFDAWLAIDREDADSFSIMKLERGERVRVDLSPFYLVWDNFDNAALRAEGDYGWPYQLVGIDLIDARERFPLMTPPDGSSAQVEAGFAAFRMYCTRCHRVNGEGGTIGPELNSPVNPTEFRKVSWLRQWIDDPAALLASARMPRLNPALEDRDELIGNMIAYLAAMSKHKVPKTEKALDAS